MYKKFNDGEGRALYPVGPLFVMLVVLFYWVWTCDVQRAPRPGLAFLEASGKSCETLHDMIAVIVARVDLVQNS